MENQNETVSEKFEEKIDEVVDQWQQETILENKKVTIKQVTTILLVALDKFINLAEVLISNGPDKKTAVLSSMDKTYDYIVKEALPIWLKPFASSIKYYILYVLVSATIDWIVAKYKEGSWGDTKQKSLVKTTKKSAKKTRSSKKK